MTFEIESLKLLPRLCAGGAAPYIAIAAAYSGTIEQYQEWIAGGSFGDPLDPMTLGGVTWYAGKDGAAAQLGDKLCLVYNVNGAAFTDSEVQAILGSLAWIE